MGRLRAEALRRAPGLALAAVADVEPERARAAAQRHGARVEPDWERLVAAPDLDAVIVATPPRLHGAMCRAAIEAGKHVLCEKPLTPGPEEGRQVLAAAERAGRVLATGFTYRFYPAVATARAALDRGLIGDLDHVRAVSGHPGGAEFTHPWVHEAGATGGGTLMDNGIHAIDLARYFLGEVAEVKGYASNGVWGFPGCEDNGWALLRSPGGRVATLQSSWTEWRGWRFRVEVYGTRGAVSAAYPPMWADAVWLGPDGRRRRRVHCYPGLQLVERLRSHRWTARRAAREELLAFALAVSGEATPALALGRDGLRAVEIAHAVYRSSREGAAVALGRLEPVR
jgi:predicted dehydrogenase